MRDVADDAAQTGHRTNCGANAPSIGVDDSASTMGEHGPWDAFRLAPSELRPNGCVAEHAALPPPDQGPYQRRTVPDIKCDAGERCCAVTDGDDIGHVEERRVRRGDPVTDGGSAQRMVDRERFDCQRAEIERRSGLQDPLIPNPAPFESLPALRARKHRALRVAGEAACMIGMGMGEEDGLGSNRCHPPTPVLATIDHNPGTPAGHQECTVLPVQPAARAGVTAGSEKDNLHDVRVFPLDYEMIVYVMPIVPISVLPTG